MHASFVIHEEKFGKLSKIENLTELAYPKDPKSFRAISFQTGIKTLTKLIELIPKYKNSKNLKEIQEKFPKVCQKFLDFIQPSKKFRNVLNHGDLWLNNFMFKYDEKGKPIECKIIDFQFARFAPIAMDLTTFIYSSSSRDFRKLHLENILQIYCDFFESELTKHNISPNVLLRQEILESFNEFRIAGLIEATVFAHLFLPSELVSNVMTSSEEYEKFYSENRQETCIKAFEVDHYRERITELLTELIDEFV